MSTNIKISIIVITYNQEKYIRAALDSIFSQKTEHKVEIIIADDASSDETPSVIREFAEKYPKKVILITRKNNLGSWNNFIDAIRRASGDYIAICEGDDFWTDHEKLQKQVSFLERNKNYSICFHPVRVFYEGGEKDDAIFPERTSGFNLESLLVSNFIQTNSVMYRRQDYDRLANNIMPGDWYLHLYHAQFGKIGFINRVMSAYRRHHGGIWWKEENRRYLFWRKNAIKHLEFIDHLYSLFENRDYLKSHIDRLANTIVGHIVDDCISENGHRTIKSIIIKKPNYADIYLTNLHKSYKDINRINQELMDLNDRLELQRNDISTELNNIKISKTWRLVSWLSNFKS